MQKETSTQHSKQSGQSMVEYALIVALVILGFAVAIAATGPAIGNVFSNTVYNLLGTDPDDIDDLPNRDAFWETVTKVSLLTPVEEPLPTQTGIPNTEVPTDGPSPTPSETPSFTPTVPTKTPTATPTPRDFEFVAPWHDSADEAEYWRLGSDTNFGTDPGWYAKYYADTTLSAFSKGEYLSTIDEDLRYNLDMDWGNGAPLDNWPAGNPSQNFSVSFRRHIFVEGNGSPTVDVKFKITDIDDGYRVWLLPDHVNLETVDPDDCSSGGVTWGGTPNTSGGPHVYGGTYGGSGDCLLIDAWGNYYNQRSSATVTLEAGKPYTVFVDMVEFSGGAGVTFALENSAFGGNADDAALDSSGAPTGSTSDCHWGNVEDRLESNSLDFMWDAREDDYDIVPGTLCHLELRGSVEIPEGMIDPILTFWDVWDFRDPGIQAYVQVAEYDPNNDNVYDPDDIVWVDPPGPADPEVNGVRVIHDGNTTNYNWTYQRINLREMLGITDPNTMENTRYAIRFVVKVPDSANYSTGNNVGYRLWWVDSINIDEAPQNVFHIGDMWALDDIEEANDFITSGRWQLSSAQTHGSGGYAWDDSPFAEYSRTALDGYNCNPADVGCKEFHDDNLRLHSLEFNGIVDLLHLDGISDLQGDSGDPMLSFWHAFDVRQYTGLRVQYTTDLDFDHGAPPVWKDLPNGNLVDVQNNSVVNNLTMSFVELDLVELLNEASDHYVPDGKIRIRWVMSVTDNTSTDQGWWIDDIQLERKSIANYLPYPYQEGFEQEETINDWILGGNWGRADNRAYEPVNNVGFSLTDSPYTLDGSNNPQDETYATNQASTAEIRLAFDVNNDSPMNAYAPAPFCELTGSPNPCDEPDNDTPIDPVLIFQWWHDFGDSGGEDFYLEWRKVDDDSSSWQTLWVYRDRMSYNSQSDNSTRRQWNWQRVEVDLRQIWTSASFDNNVPDSRTDDDIILRFRFVTNGNNGNNGSNSDGRADGVYIDDIRLQEREEQVHALWDEGVDQDVDNPNFPTTDPLIYTTGDFRYVRFEAHSEVQGKQYATIAEFNLFDVDGNDIPLAESNIIDFSSQRTSPDDRIRYMVDNDTDTEWFTDVNESHPHWFELDLGSGEQVASMSILPRQIDPSNTSWYQNGWIRDYKVYVSNDSGSNKDWELIKQGQLATTSSEQTVEFQVDYTTNTPPAGSGDTVTVTGNGVSYRDNLDDNSSQIFNNWHVGGTWSVIDWAQYDGVLSFHDSTSVPLGSTEDPETLPPDFTTITNQSPRTFNVLEMATIMDLRATPASSRPIMTFWQRHYVGGSAYIRAQVSYEDPSTIGTSGYCWDIDYDQCYDHSYGWSEWETIPPYNLGGYDDWDKRGTTRQFLWKRELFDLSAFAADGDESGKRIRIRFISDSMDQGNSNNLQDGWYIDNIEFKFYNPTVLNIDVDTGDQFFDAARNTRNWTLEGTWGLSPEFFRGSGGGPASFGGAFWHYWLYDFSDCNSGDSGFRNCVRDDFNKITDPTNNPEPSNLNKGEFVGPKGLALDIVNDWGSGGSRGLSFMWGGIWELTTPVIGSTMPAGNYTFVLTYDEALRIRYDTVPAGQLDNDPTDSFDPYDPYWNIYDDFNVGGRQVNVGNAIFESGKQYKIRMEWFDRWGDAALILSLGSSSFSFTDSPKQAAGAAFPEVPANPRAESSMIFNGVFDLSDALQPIMRYYTYHELGGTARVEVTTDGGFTWVQTGMRGSTPANFWQTNWSADFWDDNGRTGGQKMAYVNQTTNLGQTNFGQEQYDPVDSSGNKLLPPAYSFTDYYDQDLNFNWGSNQSPVSGWIRDYWSAQFRRTFTLTEPTEITFRLTSDDGHRMWIDIDGTLGYYPQCAQHSNGQFLMSGRPGISGEDYIDTNEFSCLLISDWEPGGNNVAEITRLIPAGTHTLIIDYYENGGGSKLQYEMWVGDFDDPFYGGVHMPDDGDWRQKVHSLSSFAGKELDGDPKPPIGLRFRLDRLSIGEGGTGWQQENNNNNNGNKTNWMESWWVTDITIQDVTPGDT